MPTTTSDYVFNKAIHLMDEQNELNGDTITVDTKEYRFRALSIINTLRHELYPFSDTYEVGEGGKRVIVPLIKDFEQIIDLDDAIAQGVLPYGLAAHLLLGENDAMASFFQQRYDELKYTIGANRPAEWVDLPSPF